MGLERAPLTHPKPSPSKDPAACPLRGAWARFPFGQVHEGSLAVGTAMWVALAMRRLDPTAPPLNSKE